MQALKHVRKKMIGIYFHVVDKLICELNINLLRARRSAHLFSGWCKFIQLLTDESLLLRKSARIKRHGRYASVGSWFIQFAQGSSALLLLYICFAWCDIYCIFKLAYASSITIKNKKFNLGWCYKEINIVYWTQPLPFDCSVNCEFSC